MGRLLFTILSKLHEVTTCKCKIELNFVNILLIEDRLFFLVYFESAKDPGISRVPRPQGIHFDASPLSFCLADRNKNRELTIIQGKVI